MQQMDGLLSAEDTAVVTDAVVHDLVSMKM